LIELEQNIERRHESYFRNRKVATQTTIERSQNKKTDPFETEIIRKIVDAERIDGFDDGKPLAVQSESLKRYVRDLRERERQGVRQKALER